MEMGKFVVGTGLRGKIGSWILDMVILRCPKVEVAHGQLDSQVWNSEERP